VAEGQITAAGIPVEVKNNSGSSAKVDSCKEKNGKGATPVRAKATKIILLESKVRQLERELAQACLERNAARNVLARAIDRERLANMRATEWEEAAEAAQKLAAHYEQSYIALDVHMRNCPQSATAANELLFRCHLAFNLGRAIDRSRLCRDIADYVVPLYKDRCG
jgi:hypothetical protein